jgi:galactonate dehydratase
VELLWQTLYRATGRRTGPALVSAISAIEEALWDLTGKACGLPVHGMLGGSCRERIRLCAACVGGTPADAASAAKANRIRGCTAMLVPIDFPSRDMSLRTFLVQNVEKVEAVRQAVGPAVDVAVDCHGRLSPALAIRLLQALAPHELLFAADPCPSENPDAIARVARETSVPLAVGSHLCTRWGFRKLLESEAAAVVQPDVGIAGGILESRRIAAMAEVYYMAAATRRPLGPVSLAASLQFGACTPNLLVQGYRGMPNKWDLGHGFLRTPFELRDGHIAVPNTPGLGFELLADGLEKRKHDGRWEPPAATQEEDGSFAAW